MTRKCGTGRWPAATIRGDGPDRSSGSVGRSSSGRGPPQPHDEGGRSAATHATPWPGGPGVIPRLSHGTRQTETPSNRRFLRGTEFIPSRNRSRRRPEEVGSPSVPPVSRWIPLHARSPGNPLSSTTGNGMNSVPRMIAPPPSQHPRASDGRIIAASRHGRPVAPRVGRPRASREGGDERRRPVDPGRNRPGNTCKYLLIYYIRK